MSGISRIKGWYDTKYTEGSTEIPPVGHSLGTPDITLDGPFNPSKDREFSEIRLELPFSEAMNLSYLELTYDFNNGTDQIFYAWVDDVKLMSDTLNAPMVNVAYHIDPWRTFNSKLSYGSGFVIRKPSDANDYYQSYPYRYREIASVEPIIELSQSTVWVIIAMNKSSWSGEETGVSYAVFPVSKDINTTLKYDPRMTPNGETDWTSLNIAELRQAIFDELMDNLNPENIISVSLSPINPFGITSIEINGVIDFPDLTYVTTPYSNNPLINPHYKDNEIMGQHRKTGWLESMISNVLTSHAPIDIFPERDVDLRRTYTSTEEHPVHIMGFNGEMVGEIPFGMTTNQVVKARIIATPLSSTLEIRFTGTDASSNMIGMTVDIPLPTLDSNKNAWSEYVYSGQRQNEIDARNNATMLSIVTGGLSQGAMGHVLGSMSATAEVKGNTLSKTLRPNPESMKGIAAMAGSSILSGLVEFSNNQMIQSIEDEYHAHQPSEILTTGSGVDTVFHGSPVSMVTMKYDDASQQAIEQNREVQGVKYGQSVPDCTALINAGGPMQISNLIVRGSAPVPVKEWVKQKFASGVRIIDR